MPQTTFSKTPGLAYPGMCEGLPIYAPSAILQAAAGVDAGRALIAVASTPGEAQKCDLIGGAGDVPKILGFSILQSYTFEPKSTRFAQKDAITLLSRGLIWLTCVDDRSAAIISTAIYIANTGADLGLPQASATGGTAHTGIKCLQGGTAGNLGLFAVNLV